MSEDRILTEWEKWWRENEAIIIKLKMAHTVRHNKGRSVWDLPQDHVILLEFKDKNNWNYIQYKSDNRIYSFW